jgi:Flp pilus assembly protein TadG
MKTLLKLRDDDTGAALIETAFALPVFIALVWAIIQFGMVFRANAGIQNALGEGARYATLFPTPSDSDVRAKMVATVDGIGPGTFVPTVTPNTTLKYKDLQVRYTQATTLIVFPGPTITITRSKRVWVAS